jgi:hypothetical protein
MKELLLRLNLRQNSVCDDFTGRLHCLLPKVDPLGLRGSREVESGGRKAFFFVLRGPNVSMRYRLHAPFCCTRKEEGLALLLEGGQSRGLILGSYLTKQRRNLIGSMSMQELA